MASQEIQTDSETEVSLPKLDAESQTDKDELNQTNVLEAIPKEDNNLLKECQLNNQNVLEKSEISNNISTFEDSNVLKVSNNEEVESSNAIKERLDQVIRLNHQYEAEISELQHVLTAMEAENESIGEYIALYREQRSNIQKKVTEKEMERLRVQQNCAFYEKQLNELQKAIILFVEEKKCSARRIHDVDSDLTCNDLTALDKTIETVGKECFVLQHLNYIFFS